MKVVTGRREHLFLHFAERCRGATTTRAGFAGERMQCARSIQTLEWLRRLPRFVRVAKTVSITETHDPLS